MDPVARSQTQHTTTPDASHTKCPAAQPSPSLLREHASASQPPATRSAPGRHLPARPSPPPLRHNTIPAHAATASDTPRPDSPQQGHTHDTSRPIRARHNSPPDLSESTAAPCETVLWRDDRVWMLYRKVLGAQQHHHTPATPAPKTSPGNNDHGSTTPRQRSPLRKARTPALALFVAGAHRIRVARSSGDRPTKTPPKDAGLHGRLRRRLPRCVAVHGVPRHRGGPAVLAAPLVSYSVIGILRSVWT